MKRLQAFNLSILIPTLVLASLPLMGQMVPQAGPQGGGADDPGNPGDPGAAGGVARISLLNGDVSVRRGDSGDYVAAALNAPVMVQDSIQTAPGARAEVQFDSANMVRLAQNTEMHFTDLQNGHFQMQLGRGTVTYRMLQNVNAQVEIDTTSISIRPAQPGSYRVTVTDDGQTFVTPRTGQIEIYTPRGSQMISPGQTLVARGSAADPEYRLMAALGRDDWDTWSDNRDRVFEQANAQTAPYVSPDIYGTEELQGHGRWVNTPDYGYAWSPNVGPDWSPYSAGQWTWEDYYGWTWVSADPWGWAPYHYGRWFNRPGFGWCWWPGAVRGHYFWSPAVVGFFGFGRGIGMGFGSIGWVALAPFEAFHAWWGRGFSGRGGMVGNVNIVRNVNVTSIYRNARVGNGAMSMNAQQFGRGGTGITHVGATELRSVSAVHGAVPVAPNSQSLRFTNRSTNATARTNFSQSRFATHMAAPNVQRSTFGRQAMAANAPSRAGAAGGNGSGWGRFGQTGRSFTGSSAGGNTGAAENGGWNRFGSSNSGAQRYPGSSAGQAGSAGSRQQYPGSAAGVQQRGNPAGSGYNAPRYSAPSYSAPRYSAPSYSAPHYSAPSGGGHPTSSGGGHPSGGGGGHSSGGGGHRR
jgi:hypothetical protein